MSFKAKIFKIGVNPYVLLPVSKLRKIFFAAGRARGPIPVRGTCNGHPFIQTLVKFRGKWRLYLNTPMRRAAKADVGDTVAISIAYDPVARTISTHPRLRQALAKNRKANAVYEKLTPSRQKEIVRYINHLKSSDAVDRNVQRTIQFLLGKRRFVGRDKP